MFEFFAVLFKGGLPAVKLLMVLVQSGVPLTQGLTTLVSYVNNNSFPQPLSEEEEAHYLKCLAEGDDAEEARNKLIEHNLRLVAHIAKKYETKSDDKDDLISIGTIGLIKGINTFNSGRGVKLATYAARCTEKATLS